MCLHGFFFLFQQWIKTHCLGNISFIYKCIIWITTKRGSRRCTNKAKPCESVPCLCSVQHLAQQLAINIDSRRGSSNISASFSNQISYKHCKVQSMSHQHKIQSGWPNWFCFLTSWSLVWLHRNFQMVWDKLVHAAANYHLSVSIFPYHLANPTMLSREWNFYHFVWYNGDIYLQQEY